MTPYWSRRLGPDEVYIRELDSSWFVGLESERGLPVPSLEAAIHLADVWMRLCGSRTLTFVPRNGAVLTFNDTQGHGASS